MSSNDNNPSNSKAPESQNNQATKHHKDNKIATDLPQPKSKNPITRPKPKLNATSNSQGQGWNPIDRPGPKPNKAPGPQTKSNLPEIQSTNPGKTRK